MPCSCLAGSYWLMGQPYLPVGLNSAAMGTCQAGCLLHNSPALRVPQQYCVAIRAYAQVKEAVVRPVLALSRRSCLPAGATPT